jgi:hypothetical protein
VGRCRDLPHRSRDRVSCNCNRNHHYCLDQHSLDGRIRDESVSSTLWPFWSLVLEQCLLSLRSLLAPPLRRELLSSPASAAALAAVEAVEAEAAAVAVVAVGETERTALVRELVLVAVVVVKLHVCGLQSGCP